MEEDEVEEPQTNQENEESYSLKRPKTERGPNFTEEESPEKAPQGAEVKPSRSNSLKLFSIFSKPIISFNQKPIKFNSNPTDIEVKNPPKRKTAKARNQRRQRQRQTKLQTILLGQQLQQMTIQTALSIEKISKEKKNIYHLIQPNLFPSAL